MRIVITKKSQHQCEYKMERGDGSQEHITLDTKTYIEHDICHYAVESVFGYENGFWGMLAQGYRFDQLFGKENELTEELRQIEKIVGPIQSVYAGYYDKESLPMMISHLEIELDHIKVEQSLQLMDDLLGQWRQLEINDSLRLVWV